MSVIWLAKLPAKNNIQAVYIQVMLIVNGILKDVLQKEVSQLTKKITYCSWINRKKKPLKKIFY